MSTRSKQDHADPRMPPKSAKNVASSATKYRPTRRIVVSAVRNGIEVVGSERDVVESPDNQCRDRAVIRVLTKIAAKKGPKPAARQGGAHQLRDSRLNVRMPADLLSRIAELAASENRTASALIVYAMTKYVASKK